MRMGLLEQVGQAGFYFQACQALANAKGVVLDRRREAALVLKGRVGLGLEHGGVQLYRPYSWFALKEHNSYTVTIQ